ncbi:MAG: HHL1-like protein [Synechococcales bacterium]|nr:HHL1-like protein [Synechococcales bacterium]
MTKGFGQPKQTKKPPTEGAKKRAEAAHRMDEMKAKGLPEYEVYIRIKDKKPWFPVGALAVQRSGQINQAIFANEAGLLEGALRLFPVLKKQPPSNLEYGYRLKEFKDEEIQLAERPKIKLPNIFQAAADRVSGAIGGLFKPKK